MLCETKSDSHLEYIFAYPSSFTLFCNNLPIQWLKICIYIRSVEKQKILCLPFVHAPLSSYVACSCHQLALAFVMTLICRRLTSIVSVSCHDCCYCFCAYCLHLLPFTLIILVIVVLCAIERCLAICYSIVIEIFMRKLNVVFALRLPFHQHLLVFSFLYLCFLALFCIYFALLILCLIHFV